MSIMNGIRKAMESADSGLQELIDEVVTHADELEEDASERMYAGMYGEEDSVDISSADIDDDDDNYEVPVTQSDADPETDEEDEPMLLKQRNELEAEDALESLLKALESNCCESDECEDPDDSDDMDEDTPDSADEGCKSSSADEGCKSSLESLLKALEGSCCESDSEDDEDCKNYDDGECDDSDNECDDESDDTADEGCKSSSADEGCKSSLESLINSIADPWMSVANEACDCPADSGCQIANVSSADGMEPGDKEDEDKVDPIDPDETVTRDELYPDGETTSLESLLKALEGSCCESDSKDDEDCKKNCDDGECDDSDDDFDEDDDDSYEDDDDKEESAEESLLSLLNSL